MVLFRHACLPVVAAVISVYQIVQSRKIESGAEKLTSNVTPESAPLVLTMDQKKLLMNMINKISSVELGKSKFFTAPDVYSGTFYNLGLLYFNQRDFLQAEKYLKASIEADKNNIPAINLLLQLYQSAAMNHLSDGEIEAAESALAKAEKLFGTLPAGTNLGTLTLLAYVYKSLGQVKERHAPQISKQYWDKAGKIFETVLISRKNDASALNGLGNVLYHKQQQFKDAFEKYKKALEIAPN